MKLGTALPDGVLRLEPLELRDPDAFRRLDDLLRKVAVQLVALGNPVAIAASPNRFDDAWTYDWRAVRCGDFFSEKESYMGRYDLDRDILEAPAAAKAAHGLLRELEAAGWRDLFAAAFDIHWSDQSLSIVAQDGLTWLVFSSNNVSDDGDPVFAIWEDGELSYFGEAKDRFDWAIQNPIPLVFLENSLTDEEFNLVSDYTRRKRV